MMMKEREAIAADSSNDDRFYRFGKIWQENEKAKQLRHIRALILLFEQFGFLVATFVSPMTPASINAVKPSLSAAVFL